MYIIKNCDTTDKFAVFRIGMWVINIFSKISTVLFCQVMHIMLMFESIGKGRVWIS